MEPIDKPYQAPCSFCLDTETAGLMCHCKLDCGLPDCANADRGFWYRPPVPRFGVAMPKKPEFPQAVEHEVQPMQPEDYVLAVKRIVEMHLRCECLGCKHSHNRPSCTGCAEFWPCNTMRAIRGARVPTLDAHEGIAYT